MKDIFKEKFNCECKILKSNELSDSKYVIKLIDWADIIYEGGGNTLNLISLWKETGFDKVLRKAWEDGKVLCGMSAGANCWFKQCASDSLRIQYGLEQPLITMECLGFIDGLFVPHADEEGKYEDVKELLKTSNEVGILLSNCCAIEIIDNMYRIILGDGTKRNIKPYAIKAYWEDGEYLEENLDTSLEFKPLNELLSRNIKNHSKSLK